MRLVVGVTSLDRHHQVQAFSAGHLGPARQTVAIQEIAKTKSGLDHEGPFDSVPRIEIEDASVGMLNVVHRSVPRMNLDNPKLHDPKQPPKAVNREPCAFAALALNDRELVHGLRNGWKWAAMVERRAVQVADELQWPPAEVFERRPVTSTRRGRHRRAPLASGTS